MSLLSAPANERPRAPWLVLFSPTGAFASVRESPRPWLLLAVICAVAALPGVVFVSLVDMPTFILGQAQRRTELPPEAERIIREVVAPALTVGLPILAALKRAAALLLLSILGFALLRGISKELSFKACLAALTLAVAPLLLEDGLRALLYVVRDLRSIDVRNPVLSNPAAWLGLSSQESALGAFLSGFDLFALWTAWLGAVGLNVVARTNSALPYALTFGCHALVTMASVAQILVRNAVS
jgi:hypothetical protein